MPRKPKKSCESRPSHLPERNPLTPQQLRFVDEYLVDLNAVAAYARAGYKASSERNAKTCSAAMMRHPGIRRAIETAKRHRSIVTGVTAERVLEEVAALAFSDVGDLLDLSGPTPKLKPVNEIPAAARRAIASLKVRTDPSDPEKKAQIIEYKLWDKPSALTQAGKHVGLFAEKREETITHLHVETGIDALLASLSLEASRELLRAIRRQQGEVVDGNTPAIPYTPEHEPSNVQKDLPIPGERHGAPTASYTTTEFLEISNPDNLDTQKDSISQGGPQEVMGPPGVTSPEPVSHTEAGHGDTTTQPTPGAGETSPQPGRDHQAPDRPDA